jgi:hypothetical protein
VDKNLVFIRCAPSKLDIGKIKMNEKMEKSLNILISHSAVHCHRFRLAEADLRGIPHGSLLALASSMLDVFERELRVLREKTGGNTSTDAPSDETPKGAFTEQDIRSRENLSR